jgi:Zn-dependent protease with chaperone function
MEEALTAQGRYFDGVSARPHPVTVTLTDRLAVSGPGLRRDWNLLDLRAAETVPPLTRVGAAGEAARVEFSDEALAAALAARCPDLHRHESRGGTLRLVLWSIAAGLSVLLVAVFGVPVLARLAVPLVPDAAETRLGRAVEDQVVRLLGDPPLCADPGGRAALDALVARLAGAAPDLPRDVAVSVRRNGLANALTLPGGRIVVLSDLIAKARSADEFAGVLAHEFGHAALRDPTRSLIQASATSFLLSLVLGDLTGSTVIVAVGQAALSAGYSREAERAADAYAVALMGRAGGNGAALAAILERIARDEGDDDLAFLRSHPFTRERAAAIRTLAGPEAEGMRILPDADWASLRAICGPGVAEDPAKPGKPRRRRPSSDTPL